MQEDKITKLKAIADLRDSGVLTEKEFQDQKTKIMASTGGVSQPSIPYPYGNQSYPPYGTQQQTAWNSGGDPPVDDGFRMICYIVSFLIPIAGIVIGVIYNGKAEQWHKDFGMTCIKISVASMVIGFIFGMLMFGVMMASFDSGY